MGVTLTVVVAAVVAAVGCPIAARVAVAVSLVDAPGPHKHQSAPVPYLGGVAIFLALVLPVALSRPGFLVPAGLALALGLADDALTLTARARVPFELLIGVVAVLVTPTRGALGALLVVGFVLVLLNALNLIDGLDGLAGGVAGCAALGFGIVLSAGASEASFALVGALLGFLFWNRPPARIYLGDAGSYLIGTMLALLLASAFAPGEPGSLAAGALLFVAVPVADTSVAIVRRARAHRPVFAGDRGHTYDQLVDRGWGAGAVVVACIGAQAVFVAVGVLIAEMDSEVALVATMTVVVTTAAIAWKTFTDPKRWVP